MKISTPAALAVTAAALVVASSTAGYAGARFGSADIKDGSLTSIDIKNGSLSLGDLSPGTIRTVTVGKAYAFVTRKETGPETVAHLLDTKRSYGFSKVYQGQDDGEPVTGIWCLVPAKGVDLSRSAIQVSTDYSQSAGVGIDALWSSTSFTCKADEVEIHTVQWLGDDEPSPSDNVAFQVFAP